MPEGFGVSFAPTAENAMDANRQGSLEGLPAAIKILSLQMPRFLGAKGLAPDDLLNGQGAGGMDPFASSVMQTLMSTLMGGSAPSTQIIPGYGGGQPPGTLVETPVVTPPPTGPTGPNQRPQGPFRGQGGSRGPYSY